MQAVTAILLTLLLGAMFVSLFHMSTNMGMPGCPLMTTDEVVCPMSLVSYLEAWKNTFSTLITPTFTLLLTLGVVVLVASVAPYLIYRQAIRLALTRSKQLKYSTYTYSIRPCQELFSNGILHPKLF